MAQDVVMCRYGVHPMQPAGMACPSSHAGATKWACASGDVAPSTSINGKPAVWTAEIVAKWGATAPDRPEGVIERANYYTPRLYVDAYNRGSDREGFVYNIGGAVYAVQCKPTEPR